MVPSINIYTIMHELSFIKQFQIIQSTNGNVLINVVAEEPDEKKVNLLRDSIKNRLGDVAIKVNIVDSIERDLSTGKIKTIIRK